MNGNTDEVVLVVCDTGTANAMWKLQVRHVDDGYVAEMRKGVLDLVGPADLKITSRHGRAATSPGGALGDAERLIVECHVPPLVARRMRRALADLSGIDAPLAPLAP